MDDSNYESLDDDDFEIARQNLKDLIAKGNEAMEYATGIIAESEHPRSIEVFATLLRAQTQANAELLDLHKTRKEIKSRDKHREIPPTEGITNNIVFTGTTSDLQDFISDTMKDITPEPKKIEDSGNNT